MKHIMEGVGDHSGDDTVNVGFDHTSLQKGSTQIDFRLT